MTIQPDEILIFSFVNRLINNSLLNLGGITRNIHITDMSCMNS